MGTSPLLPADEVPLDEATVSKMLAALDDDMILVGGQALAFWMDRYRLKPQDAVVSNDGDALGTIEAARQLADRLGARIRKPPASALTALVAQLRLPRADGKAANIDVLHQLYSTGGLKKCAEFTKHVVRRSVRIQLDNGALFRVMDPFDVLDSRVQNAAGLLNDKGLHVLTQAHWAIELASRVMLKLARDGASNDTSAARLGGAISDVYKLAHSQAGRAVWRDYGLDVLDAVDVPTLSRLAPAHARQLKKVKDAQEARAAGQA